MKRRALILSAVLCLAAGCAMLRRPAVQLDPDRLASAETAMWKAYYGGDEGRLGRLLVGTLHSSFGMSRLDAIRAAGDLRRAAVAFRGARRDYDALVLPHLERAYATIRNGTGREFDPQAAARAELAWWVARRAGNDNTRDIGSAIARLYGVSGAADAGEIERAGQLRAEAADLRDRTRASPDWDGIERLLQLSYEHFCKAMAPEL